MAVLTRAIRPPLARQEMVMLYPYAPRASLSEYGSHYVKKVKPSRPKVVAMPNDGDDSPYRKAVTPSVLAKLQGNAFFVAFLAVR
jgi:hypothetical protein